MLTTSQLIILKALFAAFAGAPPPGSITLRSAGLVVELDSKLPRPLSVLHVSSGVDFSPPECTNFPPPPSTHWWLNVSDHALLNAARNENCALPHCTTLQPYPRGRDSGGNTVKCATTCDTTATCQGWSLLKDTPTSGQKGQGDVCMLHDAVGLPTAAPFYVYDPNFDCGSKHKLQPNPPRDISNNSDSRERSTGGAATAAACVGIMALNGTITRFCADKGEASTAYNTAPATTTTTTAANSSSTSWTLTLDNGQFQVVMTGTVTVSEDAAFAVVGNSSSLTWALLTATSRTIQVRAVDLDFAFAGVGATGDGYYYTHSSKQWCPPGVGCMEWTTQTLHNVVGRAETAPSLPSSRFGAGWSPPLPLPFAAQELLDPSRSNGVGAWTANGSAGLGAYSSQRTLPLRRYVSANMKSVRVGFGSARINTNLRCGNVLPVTLKFGMFRDLTRDGRANADDATVWTRSNYPVADFRFRGSMTMKIDNDISSYLPPWNPSPRRVSFNDTLEYIKAISSLSDNMPMILHLVGWGGTGLDTGIYNQINSRLGTLADLQRLKTTASEKYNTILSFHVDTDNAYANLTACSAATARGDWNSTDGHPVPGTTDGQPTPGFNASMLALTPTGEYWVWDAESASMRTDPLQGPCYHINKAKDATSGGRKRRFDEMWNTIPMTGVLHMDAYRDIDVSWESDAAGFIAEDEEAACGLGWDLQWLQSHNLSLGIEGSNGMASCGGPNSPAMDVFDYYWHGHWTLGEWGRIVSGTDQGLDVDMPWAHGCNFHCTINASTNPFYSWESLADKVYLQAKPLVLRLTDTELLGAVSDIRVSSDGDDGGGDLRFSNGGNSTHWPHGTAGNLSMIEYIRRVDGHGTAVFVPEVLLPPPESAKTAPTTVNPNKIFVYLKSGGSQKPQQLRWTIPASWIGKKISSATIFQAGKVHGIPTVSVRNGVVMLSVTPGKPVVLNVTAG